MAKSITGVATVAEGRYLPHTRYCLHFVAKDVLELHNSTSTRIGAAARIQTLAETVGDLGKKEIKQLWCYTVRASGAFVCTPEWCNDCEGGGVQCPFC